MKQISGGQLVLGGLSIGAGISIWHALGPIRQQKVINFLESTTSVLGQVGMTLQQQQQPALPPIPRLQPDPVAQPPPPQWLVEAIEKAVSEYQSSAKRFPTGMTPLPQLEPDSRWREVIVSPAVVLVLGKRGSGKSALAYRLLELFRHRLAPYVVGAPSRARQLLPEWIGIVPTLADLPNKSIALVDEAYLAYHARGSMTQESKAMSQILNLSRQREQTLIFVAQEARQVDKNIASAASVVVFKELGMLQPEFERPELRKLAVEAQVALAGKTSDKRKWAYVYSPDAGFLGLLESQLPGFWKPSLSRLFAAESTPTNLRPPRGLTPPEKTQLARDLRGQGLSYSQIAQRLGVSKSTVVNYLNNYPYRG